MIGALHEHRRELVEAQLAVRLRVDDLFGILGQLERLVILLQIANAPRRLATENVLLDPVDGAADQRTELVDRGAEAAAPVELIKQPAGLELLGQCGKSEEHTSELQSLMRISYAVFCLKKQTTQQKARTRRAPTTTSRP